MICSKCGGYVPENDLRIFNGSVMCANCFEEMCQGKIGKSMDDFFNLPLEKKAGMIFNMSNLDFGNSALTCPKCGTSLKEIETEKRVGCIECFNTFGNAISKILLKEQGSTEYLGRTPAKYDPDFKADTKADEVEEILNSGSKAASGNEAEDKESINITDKTDEIKESFYEGKIGDFSMEELKKALETAVKAEDYILAAKIRDELNSRKEGGNEEVV